MTTELDAQMIYMADAGRLDPSAREAEPGSWETFAKLSEAARRQVVREVARREVEQLREDTPNVPWLIEDMDWLEMVELATQLREAAPRNLYAALREAHVPLADDGPAPPDGGDDQDMLQAMSECGVPLRGGRTPSPRQLAPLAALVDRHVPLREAVTPGTAMPPDYRRPFDLPHHVLAADLGRVIPATHPDRQHLPLLLRAGAALTGDQKALIDGLASKHSAGLQSLHTDVEPFGEAGFAKHTVTIPVPFSDQTYEKWPMEAALEYCGVPLKGQ